MRRFCTCALILIFTSGLFTNRSYAGMSIGEAALTVGASIVVGGLLGASTLPFYARSSEHKGNIGIGAAVGAVIGVFVAVYSGISGEKETLEEDDVEEAVPAAFLFPKNMQFAQLPAADPVFWAPVATIRF